VSAVASITFTFDGSENEFKRLYNAITASIDLDIGAYSKGTTGVIEFMIDDFDFFKKQVAEKSIELKVHLVALDYLVSEAKS